MPVPTSVRPWWAALTVWGVVNVVNILQGAGFLSRIHTGSMAVNHLLGYGIFVLAVPAALALAAFVVSGSGPLHWMGPAVFLAFAALMAVRRSLFRSSFLISSSFSAPSCSWACPCTN
jgi:hypothetical protein